MQPAQAQHIPGAAYLIIFVICGLSYLTAWSLMKLLVRNTGPSPICDAQRRQSL